MTQAKRVFHYTEASRLAEIVESGYLRPSNAGAAHEAPILWFSSHPVWEPTATKLVLSDDGRRLVQLTLAEQQRLLGCIRFALPATDHRLLKWKAACVAAGIRRDDRRQLERVGRKQGADPDQWFGTPLTIPLADLTFEVRLDFQWATADPSQNQRG